jgi:hypothetical protein
MAAKHPDWKKEDVPAEDGASDPQGGASEFGNLMDVSPDSGAPTGTDATGSPPDNVQGRHETKIGDLFCHVNDNCGIIVVQTNQDGTIACAHVRQFELARTPYLPSLRQVTINVSRETLELRVNGGVHPYDKDENGAPLVVAPDWRYECNVEAIWNNKPPEPEPEKIRR